MKRFQCVCTGWLAFICAVTALAQAPASKEIPPAEAAANAFFKLRDDKEAAPSHARFLQVIKSGLAFINQYPAEKRTNGVVTGLATFGTTIRDKKLAAQRAAWLPQLKYEILQQSGGEQSDEVKTAYAALAAAIAGAEMKEAPSRSALTEFREKIDRLATMPGAGRFLVDQERAFFQIVKLTNLATAEKIATSLQQHPDKAVAQMARDELNLITLAKQPLELTFTALDGRPVDVAKLRGKVLYVLFWSTTNAASVKELATLKLVQADYKKNLEIVTVSHDKETAKDAVLKQMKEARVTWPVLLDGQGAKGDFSQKLNARALPASALFDQKGILINTGVKANRLEPELKKLLGIK